MSGKYRKFTKAFKLKVVQERLRGTPVAVLIRQYDIHANLVYKWSQEYTANPQGAFRSAGDEQQQHQQTVAELEQMIGRLTMENDFLKKALQHAEEASKQPRSVPPAGKEGGADSCCP
jgi:transposase